MNEWLIDGVKRQRAIDLCYSLYESLSDLITDLEVFNSDDPDIDYEQHMQRAAMGAMNCLGDIKLLTPVFRSLESIRYP